MIKLTNNKVKDDRDFIYLLTKPEEIDKEVIDDYVSRINLSVNKTLLMLQIRVKIRDMFALKDKLADNVLPIIAKSNNSAEYAFIKDGDIAIIAESSIMTGQHVSLTSKLNPYSVNTYRTYMGLDNKFRAALTGKITNFEVKRSGTISDEDMALAKEALLVDTTYNILDTVKLAEQDIIAIEFKIVDSYAVVGTEKAAIN